MSSLITVVATCYGNDMHLITNPSSEGRIKAGDCFITLFSSQLEEHLSAYSHISSWLGFCVAIFLPVPKCVGASSQSHFFWGKDLFLQGGTLLHHEQEHSSAPSWKNTSAHSSCRPYFMLARLLCSRFGILCVDASSQSHLFWRIFFLHQHSSAHSCKNTSVLTSCFMQLLRNISASTKVLGLFFAYWACALRQ